jgi:hypothetical protein
MRWERLFSDLDARFDDLADAEMLAELADRERVAAGAISTVERLGGAVGRQLRVRTTVGLTVTGALGQIGPDWLLLQEGPGRDAVLAASAVAVIEGLSAATGPTIKGIALRLNLRYALRGIARDRSPVSLVVRGGLGEPAGLYTEITGTIDRIGADFIEVALHAPWEARRAASVRSVVLVPLSAVILVRALPLG